MVNTQSLCTIFGFAIAASHALAQCTLPLPRAYPVLGGPQAMIVADLDGNGRIDVVPLVHGSSLWPDGPRFELQPDGALIQRGTISVTGTPSSGVAADMNGDGILDLVYSLSANSGSINIARATSPGVFAVPLTTAAGQFPTTVIAVDVTGDGLSDVIARNNSGINLFRNLGAGVLDGGQVILSGSHIGLVAADIDQDGDNDIATLNAGGNSFIRILVNNGDASFIQNPDISTVTSARDVAIADMNNDGKPDIVTAARSNRLVAVHLATSTPLVYDQSVIAAPKNPIAVTVADVNGDGFADVVVANEENQGSISVHLNNGSGALLTATNIGSGPALKDIAAVFAGNNGQPTFVTLGQSGITVHPTLTNGSVIGLGLVNAQSSTLSGVIADMNQDGRPDIVGLGAVGLNVMIRQENGSYATPLTYAVASPGGDSALIARDFNGDGFPDILFFNSAIAESRIALNNGAGGLLAPVSYPGISNFYEVREDDFNGDGQQDYFIRGYQSGQGRFLYSQPGGTLTASLPISVPGLGSTVVVDVDADGRNDFVSVNSNDDFQFNGIIQRTLENGELSPREYFSLPDRAYTIAAGDFDGDSQVDFAVRTETSLFILTLNMQAQPVIIGQYQLSTRPGRLLTADFDGDGHIDVLSLNYASTTIDGGAMHILRGRGDGSFEAPITLPNGYQPVHVSIGDLNIDGHMDLLVASQAGSAVANFSILSGPFFPCRSDFNCDNVVDFFDYADFVQAFAAGTSDADFNQDGVIDLFDYLDFVAAFSLGC